MRPKLACAAVAAVVGVCSAAAIADEGMWRIGQFPYGVVESRYGVRLTPGDLARVQGAAVRILSGGGGGTGTFASPNGLILTNHHVALDCIRTSTLAEQNQASADNLIESGFTAKDMASELPCKRFRVQVEHTATDVTARMNAGLAPGMAMADIQRLRQSTRADLERACQEKQGDDFSCEVADFNSGARSELVVYEEYKDIRLVYAPEKALGYFGGDEMNFRFPRYVSDISILRAYQSKDGRRGEYSVDHVPVRPGHHLKVSLGGVNEGDFALVVGNPGNTNRYRMSFSARYNVEQGIPRQIEDLEAQLSLLRRYAVMKPDYQVVLQSQIFGAANTLKYQQDVLAGLRSTGVVAEREAREREFAAFLDSRADLEAEFGGVLDAQRAVYRDLVQANADLDAALTWLQSASVVGYATSLYEFARERARGSDAEREPQFQERRWPLVRQALLDDDPLIDALEEDLLAIGFERALALADTGAIPAVRKLRERLGPAADGRALARSVLGTSRIAAVDVRKTLVEAPVSVFEGSDDPAIVFGRDLLPTLLEQRQRIRLLNEHLFQNRALFARGLAAWKGADLYPDANFTLRATFGQIKGYVDRNGNPVPYTTRLGGLFELADSRGNSGDFALPPRLLAWRNTMAPQAFRDRYAGTPVNFVSTNDITGGNSGSSILNRRLEIVGLIFDGNEEGMVGDWTYSEKAGRALSTDIGFALMVAREVHGAGWIVDELLRP